MFRCKHTSEHWQAMGNEKKAYIEAALAKLNRYAIEGRFDAELAQFILQSYPHYSDTILLIYSGLLSQRGFNHKSHECLKTLCRYYETGKLNNTAYYKARAFLTYALSFEVNFEDKPKQEYFHLIATNIGKAIALDKNYREAKLSWCRFLEKCGQNKEAKENYEKLLKQHPDYPDAYHLYAIFLRNIGEKVLSMQVREVLLEKFPHEIKALRLYAIDVADLLDDHNESIRLLQKTLSLIGDSSEPEKVAFKAKIYLSLGISYNSIGEFEASRKAYQKADELSPQSAEVKSAKAHLKQNRGATSHKHFGKLREKIGKEFDQAMQLDPERFARNHLTGSPQTTSSVLLIESRISQRSFDYSELTAKLKFEKEYKELEKELAAFDERVHESEEFKALSDSLEFAEDLAMDKQFAAASKELNQARQQFLAKLKWINSSITGTLREFDPEQKCMLPVYFPKVVSVALPEKVIARTASSIASPIELKQEAVSVVEAPIKVISLKDKCLDLMIKISLIWQGREKESDEHFSNQLKIANKLFEDGNYKNAQTKLLAALQELENWTKHIEEQKKVVTKEKPQSPKQKPIETKQKIQKEKNPATLFAPRQVLQKDSSASFSMYALYFSLPLAAILLILCAFYYQLSSVPEQVHRFKK